MRDGRLYARGVSDDKGPMLIPIAVAAAFFRATGGLPVNVKFLFEGEEEIGSPSLDAFIREHAAFPTGQHDEGIQERIAGESAGAVRRG